MRNRILASLLGVGAAAIAVAAQQAKPMVGKPGMLVTTALFNESQ